MFYPEYQEKEPKNLLLEGPELASPEKEIKQEGEMSFSFSSDTRRYYLGNEDDQPFFRIEYFDSLPDELSDEEKEKFTKETRGWGKNEKTVYVLKYGKIPEPKEETKELDPNKNKKYRVALPRDFGRDMINDFFSNDEHKQVMGDILTKILKFKPEKASQMVEQTFETFREQDNETIHDLFDQFSKENIEKIRSEIREIMLPEPKEIKLVRLVDILKNKKVLFYTGAGISMASGVHSMNQLHETLGIEMSEKIDDLLKKAVTNPQSVIESWEEFTKATVEKPPTPTHQSLGKLAQKLNSQIITENVDHLQEKTGVKAIHLTGPWLKENIQPEWLKDIDAVITVGLSYDDRGFLGWYKENNPNGKIIAVNLSQPPYLGDEDFMLKGDCQKIIPELGKAFNENK